MWDSPLERAAVLTVLDARLAERSPTLANPHPTDSLAWAAWIIARLGGWNGYASSRPPGSDHAQAWPRPIAGGGSAVVHLGELIMILDLHRQGLSGSAIARQLGLDRKTVRKHIAR